MEMTIDEAINYLITPKIASTEVTPEMQKQLDAHAIAIDTMRKYQKIVDIVSLNSEEFKQCGLKELKEILEVIADGNNTN